MIRFKLRPFLPDKKITVNDNLAQNQKGQSIVEFVLLLASITIVSFGMLQIVNNNISQRWEKIANIILDDPEQQLIIK